MPRTKKLRISLATKCQMLFGAAVILIVSSALTVVWHRMQLLVREGQEYTASKLAETWLEDKIARGIALHGSADIPASLANDADALVLIDKEDFDTAGAHDEFLARAVERFQTHAQINELSTPFQDVDGRPFLRYARALRKADLARIGPSASAYRPGLDAPGLAGPPEKIIYIQLHSDRIATQLLYNRMYTILAGLVACLLAIGVFWFVTTRLILSPVHVLRETAEKVSEGDINIRADVNTGDEFEQLAEIFNHMLENLRANQEELSGANKSLDLKLGELAQSNVSLYEANKIKGEFLANVSHELRTPLNSIIGFAEVLEETLKDRTGPMDEKRKRYAANIITSSRRLLDLINDLLDLAKIEAGRIDLRVAPMSVSDTTEGLANLIRPQAEKKQIDLRVRVAPNLPLVQTDAGKFQQILFNFLSNAVKFTPGGGTITLSASLTTQPASAVADGRATVVAAPPAGPAFPRPHPAAPPTTSPASNPPPSTAAEGEPRLIVSVADTGPGIPIDQHERVFEKFTQLDSTVTKEFGGTGLGLTISRELADLLQGQIILESDTGKGATFSLMIPLTLEAKSMALMPQA